MSKNKEGLTVVVGNGRWEALAPTPVSFRDRWLYSYLDRLGGVNESTPDGTYRFNITRKGFNLEASLLPVEEN